MPPYPIPVILLARLAVDKSQHGQGIGAGLLKDALLRALHASEIAGLRAMLVHAKDTAAESFYKKFGFEPSPRVPLHLFLTMSQIEAMLGPVRH
jgi:predicted N-acetyltransferase YhbS